MKQPQTASKTVNLLSALLVVMAISCIPFCCTIRGHFVFDDLKAVVRNADVSNLRSSWLPIFQHDFWGLNISSALSHKSYRPITILIFRIQHGLAGSLKPSIFHAVNVGLHVFCCTLCFWLTLILVEAKRRQPDRAVSRKALLAVSLFAVHPIHTESIASVVGQADLLYTAFCLLGTLAYCRGLQTFRDDCSLGMKAELIAATVLFATLSMLCKEQGLITMAVCALHDVFINMDNLRKMVDENKSLKISHSSKMQITKRCQRLVLRLFILGTFTIALLALRLIVMKNLPAFGTETNPHSFVENRFFRLKKYFWQYHYLSRQWPPDCHTLIGKNLMFGHPIFVKETIINYSYLYSLNMWLLLCPWWLCYDWSHGCVPVINSLSDQRILAVLLFWVALLTLTWRAVRELLVHNERRLAVPLLLLLVPFLPASNLFFRVGFVLAERVLYLPCLGFCILVATGWNRISLHQNRAVQVVSNYSAVLLLALFAGRSYLRCQDWLDEYKLYRTSIMVCPNNAKLHYNMAVWYKENKKTEMAKQFFENTIRLHPSFTDAYNGMGNVYLAQSNLTWAEKYFEMAVNISLMSSLLLKVMQESELRVEATIQLLLTTHLALNDYKTLKPFLLRSRETSKPHLNFCYTLFKMNRLSEAENCTKLVLINEKMDSAYFGLGQIYYNQEKFELSLEAFFNATKINPLNVLAWEEAFLLLYKLGRLRESKETFQEAIKHLPKNDELYFKWGKLNEADFATGEKNLKKAIELNSQNVHYYQILSDFYYRWNKAAAAKKYKMIAESAIRELGIQL